MGLKEKLQVLYEDIQDVFDDDEIAVVYKEIEDIKAEAKVRLILAGVAGLIVGGILGGLLF
jgi:hypothetical protein